jgi:hypothetical protein
MKMFYGTLALVCLVFADANLTSAPYAAAAELAAGVASADITPEAGLRMWGYSSRTKPAAGTLDPLMAKALVLKSGDDAVALVALDLGRTPEEALLDRLREQTASSCGINQLFITASHTHQAPSLESYDGQPNAFALEVIDALAKLINKAASNVVPVRLGVGHAAADFAHNRRRFLRDGRVAMQWRNAEREPTSPVDKECTIVRLDRQDGSPLAVLFHYACHPVVLGGDNLEYSADFVGAARRVVEHELETTCLFLQGGCGNINPYMDKTPLAQGGIAEMRKMGTELGRLLLETARGVQSPESTSGSLHFEQRNIPTSVRWDFKDPEVRALFSQTYGARFDRFLAPLLERGTVDLALTTLLINDRVALVGMPGEVFVDFQLDLKQRGPVADTLLVGYTNGYHAYFPTIRDAAAGGYGGKTATYMAVGTGERLTNESLITLYHMLDALHDAPRPSDLRLIEWNDVKPSAGN